MHFGYFWVFLVIFGYFWEFWVQYCIVLYQYCIDIVSILYWYCINTYRAALEGRRDIFNIFDHFFTGTHVFTLLFVISRGTRLLPSWACYFVNLPLTNLKTREDFPTADSPRSTNLNWQILPGPPAAPLGLAFGPRADMISISRWTLRMCVFFNQGMTEARWTTKAQVECRLYRLSLR